MTDKTPTQRVEELLERFQDGNKYPCSQMTDLALEFAGELELEKELHADTKRGLEAANGYLREIAVEAGLPIECVDIASCRVIAHQVKAIRENAQLAYEGAKGAGDGALKALKSWREQAEAAQRALAEATKFIPASGSGAEFGVKHYSAINAAIRQNAGGQAQVNAGEKRQAQANGPDASSASPAPDALTQQMVGTKLEMAIIPDEKRASIQQEARDFVRRLK